MFLCLCLLSLFSAAPIRTSNIRKYIAEPCTTPQTLGPVRCLPYLYLNKTHRHTITQLFLSFMERVKFLAGLHHWLKETHSGLG